MPKIELDKEQAQQIYWDEDDRYKKERIEIIDDSGRWSITKRMIFRDVETGKYYELRFDEAKTELQDNSDMFYPPNVCYEVIPVEETVIKYKKVED